MVAFSVVAWRVRKTLGKLGTRRALPPLVGAMVGVAVFVLYLATLAPGVLSYQRPEILDSPMLQVHAATLSITHPTGYPTWTMLTHLFTYLPLGSDAYASNLFSAVHGALAVFFVYAAAYLLTRSVAASLVGGLAFGLTQALWAQSNLAEIYALNAAFEAALIFTLLLWRRRRNSPDTSTRSDRYLLAASFLLGLAMTNHMTSGLLFPAGALFVFLVDRSRFSDLGLVLKSTGLFLLGLLPYLYLPIRASMNPDSMEFDPSSPERFWRLVSGSSLNGQLIGLRPTDLADKLGGYFGYLTQNLSWPLLALAAVGLVILARRDRAGAAFTGFLFTGWLLHALAYNILDVYIYFIPTYMILSLWAAAGAGAILEAVRALGANRSRSLVGAASALISASFILFAVSGVGDTYSEVNRSDSTQGRRTIEAVADNVETGATVIHHRSPLWYMVLVEERRRDLTLLDPYYPAGGPRHYDTVWPGDLTPEQAQRRYATLNDDLGVEAALRAAKSGPVYILDSGLTSGSIFFEEGFDVIHVEGGILYELVPRDDAIG